MDAKKKELESRRAAAASKATKTFYKITVKVHAVPGPLSLLTSARLQTSAVRRDMHPFTLQGAGSGVACCTVARLGLHFRATSTVFP